MKTLKNAQVTVEFCEDKKEIFGQDLIDKNNEPAFYSKSKRGIVKAWDALEKSFQPTWGMWDVMHFLDMCQIRTHSWCMMD